jgi:hypothetical protein
MIEKLSFGSIRIDGISCNYEIVIDREAPGGRNGGQHMEKNLLTKRPKT